MSGFARWLMCLLAVAPLTGCAPLVATGVGAAGVMIADDRRTTGTYLLDEEIELRAGHRVRDKRIEGVHANFTSFNRRVLVTGEAPTEAAKGEVTDIVRAVPNVREVVNDLTVMPPSGFTSRSTDGYVTAKVKTRFLEDERFSANHVKVVTERGVVYLMGLVKRDEASAAAEIAARTSGVTKVIKVFEYMD